MALFSKMSRWIPVFGLSLTLGVLGAASAQEGPKGETISFDDLLFSECLLGSVSLTMTQSRMIKPGVLAFYIAPGDGNGTPFRLTRRGQRTATKGSLAVVFFQAEFEEEALNSYTPARVLYESSLREMWGEEHGEEIQCALAEVDSIVEQEGKRVALLHIQNFFVSGAPLRIGPALGVEVVDEYGVIGLAEATQREQIRQFTAEAGGLVQKLDCLLRR